MGLEIKQLEPTATVHVVVAEERLWQTEDKETLVPEGHPDAAFLYCVPGQQLSLEEAKQYGLIKGSKAKKAATAAGGDEKPTGEKTIDEMSGPEIDAFAAELNVDGWKPKAKVDAKKATLKAVIAERLADAFDVQPDGLDDLSDEELAAKADELEVEGLDEDADRDDVLAAVRSKLAEASGS